MTVERLQEYNLKQVQEEPGDHFFVELKCRKERDKRLGGEVADAPKL